MSDDTDGAVAWAVCNPAGVYYRSYGYRHEALACCLQKVKETGDDFFVRPLYADQTRLTDAEREAVEWCVEMAVLHATECDDEIAALRGLLERTQ